MKILLDKEDSIFNPPQLGCVLSLTGLPGGGNKTYDRSPYGNIGTIIGATWMSCPQISPISSGSKMVGVAAVCVVS